MPTFVPKILPPAATCLPRALDQVTLHARMRVSVVTKTNSTAASQHLRGDIFDPLESIDCHRLLYSLYLLLFASRWQAAIPTGRGTAK